MANIAETLSPQYWSSKSVKKLGVAGKMLYAILITGPHNVNLPGLARVPLSELYQLGEPLTRPEVEDALKSIVAAGKAIYDWDRELLRIPSVWRHRLLPNPNQIQGWKKEWLKFPDVPMRYDHLETLELLAHRGKTPEKIMAFRECFCGIVPGDPTTYELFGGRRKKLGKDQPVHSKLQGFLDTNIDHLYFSRRDPEDPTGNGNGTWNENTPLGKGSVRVTQGEGFGKGSGRVTQGLGKGSVEPVKLGYSDDFGGDDDFEEDLTDERRKSAGHGAGIVSESQPGSGFERPSSVQPRLALVEPLRDPAEADGRGPNDLPKGSGGGGGSREVAPRPVPPVGKPRYRHE